jgi:two-component system, OmpR family, alkaline phosphatase synthesis response regulator PhoP
VARILICDDEPNIVVSLEFLMRRQGHEIRVVGDGDAALAAAAEFAPDLVLLDLMLPGRDGYSVCQTLRAGGQRMKIIMLTAKGREAEVAKGLAVGADDYVTKPFGTQDLVARVQQLLEAGA